MTLELQTRSITLSAPFLSVRKLIANEALVEPLRSLLGPNITFITNRHNQAALNSPGQFVPRFHRDVLQWSRNLVTAIVYLEDATVESGCTYIVPGSHFFPFVGVPQVDGGGTWMDEHVVFEHLDQQAVPVEMRAGDVLLFDSLVFHSVGANTSDRSRSSLTFGYRSADELDASPDTSRQILVSGEFLYRGNDRQLQKK